MNTTGSSARLRFPSNLEFDDRHPPAENLLAEALEGLGKRLKSLPPKLFYDSLGSDLFLQITGLPEYYPTRIEKALLPRTASDLHRILGPRPQVIEYGCGNSGKVNLLLKGLDRAAGYVAIDISKEHLLRCCIDLAASYPETQVRAVCADFTRPLPPDMVLPDHSGRRLAFFPGSSIGNFDPEEAVRFLENIRETVGSSGGLLIGVDVKKSPELLHAAYNDAQGVTARFNRNVLARINREAGANFDLEGFRHRAFYDALRGRIEMHLESLKSQTVKVGGAKISFREGETIHTENSYKYSPGEFQELARAAGWRPDGLWQDEEKLFSLHYLENWKGRASRTASNFRLRPLRSAALTLIKA